MSNTEIIAQIDSIFCGKKIKVKVGDKFGRWTVISSDVRILRVSNHTLIFLMCKCECGVEDSIRHNNLKRGLSYQCGKCKYNDQAAKNRTRRQLLIGTFVGEWKIIEDLGLRGRSIYFKSIRNGIERICALSSLRKSRSRALNKIT